MKLQTLYYSFCCMVDTESKGIVIEGIINDLYTLKTSDTALFKKVSAIMLSEVKKSKQYKLN